MIIFPFKEKGEQLSFLGQDIVFRFVKVPFVRIPYNYLWHDANWMQCNYWNKNNNHLCCIMGIYARSL